MRIRAANWFSEQRIDETLSTMPEAMVAVIALAAIGVALHPVTWRFVGYPVTVVHELGHAIAALTAGFRIQGITVNGDMSGATNFWSHSTLGTIWATWWGYPTPAVAGWALVWASAHGWARLAIAAVVLCLLFVFLLSRSWLTIAVVLATGVTLGLLGWFGSPWAWTTVVFALAWLLIVGAVRGLWTVTRTHLKGRGLESSDAYLLSEHFILPGAFWLLTFAAAIGACGWFSVTTVAESIGVLS